MAGNVGLERYPSDLLYDEATIRDLKGRMRARFYESLRLIVRPVGPKSFLLRFSSFARIAFFPR